MLGFDTDATTFGVATQTITVERSSLQILAAGKWKNPAFLHYLDLELGAVIEAHQAESSSEDEV